MVEQRPERPTTQDRSVGERSGSSAVERVASSVPSMTSGSTSLTRPRATELITENGRTTIADTVVAKIAAIAAREIPGVHELVPHSAASAIAGLTQRVTGDVRTAGVRVDIGEQEAVIDVRMVVEYGISIPQVAEAVRRNIMNRIQGLTGLSVREVNIEVTDLFFPEDVAAEAARPAESRGA